MSKNEQKIDVPYNIGDQVAGLLKTAGDMFWKTCDRKHARHGITESHYNALRILNGSDTPLSQIELGKRLITSRANVSNIIDKLEKMELVKRVPGEDRRTNLIELTCEGYKFIRETLDEMIAHSENNMSALTTEEQKILLSLLKKLIESKNTNTKHKEKI